MNIVDRAKRIAHGVQVISEWLGEGGHVVDQEVAQHRANVCLKCPNNDAGFAPATATALAIRKHLEVKNKIGLRVEGEKSIHTCAACSCVLRLLIWEPQDRVKRHMTEIEKSRTPDFCWKLE